jgi:hypothetical protein
VREALIGMDSGLEARLVRPEVPNAALFLLLDPESLAAMMRAPRDERLIA